MFWKKRTMIAFVALCSSALLLTGCESSSSKPVDGLYNGEMKLEFAYGEREGSYCGQVNSDGLPDGYGVFSSVNDEGVAWDYAGEWSNGHFEGYAYNKWDNGQIFMGQYSNDLENGFGVLTVDGITTVGEMSDGAYSGKGAVWIQDGIFCGHLSDNNNGTGVYYNSDGSFSAASLVNGELILDATEDGAPEQDESTSDASSTSTVNQGADFFSSEKRQEKYRSLYESYKYSKLKTYVEKYIKEGTPSKSDSAYAILDCISPVAEREDKWKVQKDDFDNSYTVTFPGAEKLSSDCSICVKVKGGHPEYQIGFEKKGWLFFDEIQLSVDGEVVCTENFKSYDVQRDVLSGSTITEFVYTSFGSLDFSSLENAKKVTLRFTNSDSKETYDHKLTSDEIEALRCGKLLETCNRELSDLRSHYNQDNP